MYHKVSTPFCQVCRFSSVNLRFEVHTCKCGANYKHQASLSVKDLFKVEGMKYSPPLKFIANSKSKLWLPHYPSAINKPSESEMMIKLMSTVFVPLCSDVTLESRYARILDKCRMPMPDDVHVGAIGLGSAKTWHGTPDARVGGVEVVQRVDSGQEWALEANSEYDSEDDSEDEGSDQSDGNNTQVEGKLLTLESNLAQAVSTCVVASFTQKTRHPELKAMVPTVLIDEREFRVILYDCEKDILLISISKALASKKGRLSRGAMALLWLVINHR